MRKPGRSRLKGTLPHIQTGTDGHMIGLSHSVESTGRDRRVQHMALSMSYGGMKTGIQRPRMEHTVQSIFADISSGRIARHRAIYMADMECFRDSRRCKHVRRLNTGVHIPACIDHGRLWGRPRFVQYTTGIAACSCGHRARYSDIDNDIGNLRYWYRYGKLSSCCDGNAVSPGRPKPGSLRG
jgi:hypothetical protein